MQTSQESFKIAGTQSRSFPTLELLERADRQGGEKRVRWLECHSVLSLIYTATLQPFFKQQASQQLEIYKKNTHQT